MNQQRLSPEQTVLVRIELRRAWRLLTEKQRTVIMLYLYDYNQEEVAEMANISQQAVSKIIKRARENMPDLFSLMKHWETDKGDAIDESDY